MINGGTLKSVRDCYKKIKKCIIKAVGNYPHAIEFVPEFFMIQKMCDKPVNTYSYDKTYCWLVCYK